MSEKNIENKKKAEAHSRTDWERVRKMKDEEIDYSDIPKTTPEFWKEDFPKVSVLAICWFDDRVYYSSGTATRGCAPSPGHNMNLNTVPITYYQPFLTAERTFVARH